MSTYDDLRMHYLPKPIKVLLLAESPPPAATVQSSRHFYRAETFRKDDRLFVNTIKALYPAGANKTETELEAEKETWLRQFQADGYYMMEALEASQIHEVTKKQRQALITESLPRLITRLRALVAKDTKIILIKSNVFEAAAEPLKAAGFTVLNTALVDYPGQYNQKAYRDKLARLLDIHQTS
jgi:hypothetical protein